MLHAKSHISDHTSVAKEFDVTCAWTMPQLLWASQEKDCILDAGC